MIERVLTCYHAFCKECIEDWRSRDPTCPLCRAENDESRGSFEMIRGISHSEHSKLRTELMRELTMIIGDLIGETIKVNEENA